MTSVGQFLDIEELHRTACERGEGTYIDPASGYTVMTEATLRKRGRCCGNGCRHCPYGHLNVKDPSRKANLVRNTLLLPISGKVLRGKCVDVLSFSGGKDSYLASQRLRKELAGTDKHVVLMTTFSLNGMVGHQQVPFREVVCAQAKALGLDVLAIPLFPSVAYAQQVQDALEMLQIEHGMKLERLVFGDLHVQYIYDWRLEHMKFSAPLDAISLHFPVWQVDYDALASELDASGADVFVCAIGDNCPEKAKAILKMGTRYDKFLRDKLANLEEKIDVFGEMGEFHSVVVLPGMNANEVLTLIGKAQAEELDHQIMTLPISRKRRLDDPASQPRSQIKVSSDM